MTESNFVNPNGLPADGQIVSARDLGHPGARADSRIPANTISIGTFRRQACQFSLPAVSDAGMHDSAPVSGCSPGARRGRCAGRLDGERRNMAPAGRYSMKAVS